MIIIFLTVIYTYLRLMYTADTDSSRRFRNLVLLLIFANLADVLTAVDISYAPILPHWINIASNSLYFSLTASLMFYYIKYIEGFSRGLQTTKTVDAGSVLDCVGEIMEYMKTLKGDILDLLQHCENIMEQHDEVMEQNKVLLQEIEQIKLIPVKDKENKEEIKEEEDGRKEV